MLCLRVDYLMGRVFAASHLGRDEVEWPPHPSRLFSALVATVKETGLGDEAADALRWLEAETPPEVIFHAASPRETGIVYVPVNDRAFKSDTPMRDRQPRTFPSASPQDSTMWFVWRRSAPTPAVAQQIEAIASDVPRLGHSASLVRITVDPEPPDGHTIGALHWVPSDTGSQILRVPNAGRLESLERSFDAGRRPATGAVRAYGSFRDPAVLPTRGTFAELRIFQFSSSETPRTWATIAHTLRVAETIRAAWWQALQPDAPPAIVHGHEGRHVAILPLAAVGHRNSDGRVHGVGIAIPHDISAEERTALDASLAKLPGALVYGHVGRWSIQRVGGGGELPRALAAETWIAADRFWTTATPIVLDRFPRRSLDVADVIADSMARLGLPTPNRIRVDQASAIPGVPLARHFQVRRDGQPPRPAFHVTVEFPTEVAGPVVIGQLRYFGLGLMRPAGDWARTFLDQGET